MTSARLDLLALLTTIGCTLVVVVRVALAPAAPLRGAATPAERARLASSVASEEAVWMKASAENFPADRWSQRDDFHGHEDRKMETLAGEKKVRIEDVLRGVDDDLHRRNVDNASAPDHRNARAVPCKPRPIYD